MYSHGCGNESIYAMYIYVYTDNFNNIITVYNIHNIQ
jgi:hypothetical protein